MRLGVAYLIFGAGMLVLAALPSLDVLTLEVYSLLIAGCFFAMYAMSWDLLGGYGGQVVLGQALFIGTAAYTSGLLSLELGWSPLATIPLGTLAAVGVGALIGAPAVRLRGPYLALVTLIALIAASKLVRIFSDLTGGSSGLIFTPDNFFPPLGYSVPLDDVYRTSYYYTLGLLAFIGVGLLSIVRSRWGVILTAIREDEAAVEAAGINPAKFKVAAFMVSAAAAGLAGAAYVHLPTLAGVQPGGANGVLSLNLSLLIVVASVVGGLGTIVGPTIGAFLLVVGREYLAALPDQIGFLAPLAQQGQGWITLIFLVFLVVLVQVAPRGLLPTLFARRVS